jgi:hypothetical protein
MPPHLALLAYAQTALLVGDAVLAGNVGGFGLAIHDYCAVHIFHLHVACGFARYKAD